MSGSQPPAPTRKRLSGVPILSTARENMYESDESGAASAGGASTAKRIRATSGTMNRRKLASSEASYSARSSSSSWPRASVVLPLVRNVRTVADAGKIASRASLNAPVGAAGISRQCFTRSGSPQPKAAHSRR